MFVVGLRGADDGYVQCRRQAAKSCTVRLIDRTRTLVACQHVGWDASEPLLARYAGWLGIRDAASVAHRTDPWDHIGIS